MKKQYRRKIIGPAAVTVIILLYLVIYGVGLIRLIPGVFFKAAAAVIPALLAAVMVFVLIERIKEIRSGEEDDLSKY